MIVRTCAKTYNDDEIKKNGISIEEVPFPDGRKPPKEIILKWIKIVTNHFKDVKPTPIKKIESNNSPEASKGLNPEIIHIPMLIDKFMTEE